MNQMIPFIGSVMDMDERPKGPDPFQKGQTPCLSASYTAHSYFPRSPTR